MVRSVLAVLLLVSACHHDRDANGPFERAGKGVDNAAQKTGDALGRAGEATGDALERAGNATGKAFKGAGTDLGVRGSPDAKPASSNPPRATKPAPEIGPDPAKDE